MKTLSKIAILAIVIISSCGKNSTKVIIPKLDIIYSAPPINLDNIDVQYASDIFYDDHDLTSFDIFLPQTNDPTGLVIFIHGGGFKSGDKDLFYNDFFAENIRDILSEEIAVATINYRLIESTDSVGIIKPLYDSKRALQFIRYFHEEFNIRKDDIVLFGSSSGAGTALWLATHKDMREEGHYDLVEQESTRVKGIALRGVQSTYNFDRWISDVFDDFDLSWDDYIDVVGDQSVFNIYGVSSWEDYYTPEVETYKKQVDMLSMISSDDPDIWLQNSAHPNGIPTTRTDINHHAFHAQAVKERADEVGVANICKYGDPLIYSHPSEESYVDFLIRKVRE